MSWSNYWIGRARTAARRQKRFYGLEVPGALTRLLEREEPRLGLAGSLRVLAFVLFGSPRARLHLYWHHLADLDTPARIRKIESLARDLRGRLSGTCRVSTGSFERQCFSRDLARVPRILEKILYRTKPLLVVQPQGEQDVLTILAFASERRIPVYPRGVSSSAFGGTIPTRNGLVLDFSSMAEILAVDTAARTARMQPGARWADLARFLERQGMACVTTPSSRFSTVGGWASTGGLGVDGFGYGHFSQAIASARIALIDGKVQSINGGHGLRDFLGTEGQLGIFTELTLRVRPKSDFSSPRLAYFEDPRAALIFVGRLIKGAHKPTHVAFFDRVRMAEENRLFRDRTGKDQTIVEERDAVLMHFDDAGIEATLPDSAEFVRGPGARYLWAERFFPLKAQRLGPGLLASEVVLPLGSVPDFIDRARGLSARFGIKPAIEAIISLLSDGSAACVAISSFPCDPARKWNYLLRLLLVQMLLHVGVRLGGRPYGLGIWNTPFLAATYSAGERHSLLRRKQELDPHQLLNPNKFFGIRTRFFNFPGLLFRPAAFRTALALARLLSPLLGALSRIGEAEHGERWCVPSADDQEGTRLLLQAALRCTSCGSCVSACPAYLLTGDELVTGRSKLRMSEAWLAGEEIQAAESHRPFQCLRCGLCEEVCQTRLPLRECYLVLEKLIEKRHGYPKDLVQGFVQRLDASRELIQATFGLDIPDWLPAGQVPDLRDSRGGAEASPC